MKYYSIIVLCLLLFSAASAIDINPGNCVWVYPSDNLTSIQVRLDPDGNLISIDNTTPLELCAGNITFAEDYCYVHELMQPGELLMRVGGRCDVVISTAEPNLYAECDSCCPNVTFANYSVDVGIYGNRDVLNIQYNNRSIFTNFSLFDNYSWSFKDTLTCPKESEVLQNLTTETCKTYLDWLDGNGSWMSESLVGFRECSGDLGDCYVRLQACTDNTVAYASKISACETASYLKDFDITNLTEALDDQSFMYRDFISDELTNCEQRVKIVRAGSEAWTNFWLGCFIILLIICAVYLLLKESGGIF